MRPFLLGVACFFAAPLFCQINPKAIENTYRESIVKIHLFDKEKLDELKLDLEQDGLLVGSGVIVTDEGHIFTSKLLVEKAVKGYLIADWIDDDKSVNTLDVLTYVEGMEEDPHILKVYAKSTASIKVEVFDPLANDYCLFDAVVIALGSQCDAAVLKINNQMENRHFKPMMIGNSNRVSWGKSCMVTGFSTPEEIEGCRLSKSDTITSCLGVFKEKDYYFDPDNGMLTIDITLPEGLAGSAVIAEDERVAGIVSQVGCNSCITMAVPSNAFYEVISNDRALVDKLTKNGLRQNKRVFRKFF